MSRPVSLAVAPARSRLTAPFDSLKRRWIKDGFVVIKNAYGRNQIAEYNALVDGFRSRLDDGKDDNGFGDRIGQLHQAEPKLLELCQSREIDNFLNWAFGEAPVLMGSLQFEKGTQQEAHIDAIFFWPQPAYAMAGVWIALEDIHPDSGPLFYIPGSHRWPFSRSEHVVQADPDLARKRQSAKEGHLTPEERAQVVGEIGAKWTEQFLTLERQKSGKRVPICLQAGDAVVWHSLLAHGGSPRLDVTKSRRSVVFHYFGQSAKLFTDQDFMLYDDTELEGRLSTVPPIRQYKNLKYMKFPYFVTYSKGKDTIHTVTE